MSCLLCTSDNLEAVRIVHIYGYRLYYMGDTRILLCESCLRR